MSAVVGLGVTTEARQVPAPTLAVIFAGQEIVGFVLSINVKLNEQLDELPLSSVAVIVIGTTFPAPDTIVLAVGFCVIVTDASQLSLAIATKAGNKYWQFESKKTD